MDGREFYRRIEADERFEWLGSKEGATPAEDEALVAVRGGMVKFAISISAIGDHSWEEFESILTEQRGPRVMTHVTRIVGYYSQLQNWNRSKLAELRDRHRGNYAVPELKKRNEEGDGGAKEESRQEAAVEATCSV